MTDLRKVVDILPDIIECVQNKDIDYSAFYNAVDPIINYMYNKKFKGNDSCKDDLGSCAHFRLYEEFFIRNNDLQAIKNIFNYICKIIYIAFYAYLDKNKDKENSIDAGSYIEEFEEPTFDFGLGNTYNEHSVFKALSIEDKLLVYNTTLKSLIITPDELDICKYLLFLQVFDKSRYSFSLPKKFSSIENINYYKNYIKAKFILTHKRLKSEGVI